MQIFTHWATYKLRNGEMSNKGAAVTANFVILELTPLLTNK
jgi:hypothetical protein